MGEKNSSSDVIALAALEKVPTEKTILSLCRAVQELQKMEFLEIPLIDESIGLLNESILNLCGVPEDNCADGNWEKPDLFVRDWLLDELEEVLNSGPKDEDLLNLPNRMQRKIEEVRNERAHRTQ